MLGQSPNPAQPSPASQEQRPKQGLFFSKENKGLRRGNTASVILHEERDSVKEDFSPQKTTPLCSLGLYLILSSSRGCAPKGSSLGGELSLPRGDRGSFVDLGDDGEVLTGIREIKWLWHLVMKPKNH